MDRVQNIFFMLLLVAMMKGWCVGHVTLVTCACAVAWKCARGSDGPMLCLLSVRQDDNLS